MTYYFEEHFDKPFHEGLGDYLSSGIVDLNCDFAFSQDGQGCCIRVSGKQADDFHLALFSLSILLHKYYLFLSSSGITETERLLEGEGLFRRIRKLSYLDSKLSDLLSGENRKAMECYHKKIN